MKKISVFLTAFLTLFLLAAAVHAGSPTAEWNFDEADAAGNYTDSISGKTAVPTGTTVVEGISGNALYFDGTSSVVSVENFDILTDDTPRTVIAWVKIAPEDMLRSTSILAYGAETDDSDITQSVWKIATGGENGGLWYSSKSDYNYFRGYNSEIFWDGFALYDDGIWHQIAVTYNDEGEMHMYVDGSEVTVGKDMLIFTAPESTLYLGASGYKEKIDEFFRGAIDEVSFYDYAMSDDEVLLSYLEICDQADKSAITPPFGTGLGYALADVTVEQDWFSAYSFPIETTIDRYIRANTPTGMNPFWHTQWEDETLLADFELPLDIYVTLTETQEIGGIGLFPRQDGSHAGKIISCEVYVSEDKNNWTLGGTASGFIVDPESPETGTNKVVAFEKTVTGKYIWIRLTETRSSYASLNEIFVYPPEGVRVVKKAPVIEEITDAAPLPETSETDKTADESQAEIPAAEETEPASPSAEETSSEAPAVEESASEAPQKKGVSVPLMIGIAAAVLVTAIIVVIAILKKRK